MVETVKADRARLEYTRVEIPLREFRERALDGLLACCSADMQRGVVRFEHEQRSYWFRQCDLSDVLRACFYALQDSNNLYVVLTFDGACLFTGYENGFDVKPVA